MFRSSKLFANLLKNREIAKLCFAKVSLKYLGHGQCFIWEFLVLAFIETARLNTILLEFFPDREMTQFWSVSHVCQVCKLKRILDNIYMDRFLLVAFVKYILSQIYTHSFQNCTFRDFLETVETFIFWEYFHSLVIFVSFLSRNQ